MWAFLLVLDAIGAVIKPFALAIRLFANMVAGHIVLATIVGLILAFRGFAMQAGGGLVVAGLQGKPPGNMLITAQRCRLPLRA